MFLSWISNNLTSRTSILIRSVGVDFAKCRDLILINPTVVFLERLQSLQPLPSSHLQHLANVYLFSSTFNAEIRLRFYELVLNNPNAPIARSFAVEAAKWVVGDDDTGVIKGRMKFCRPVLRAVSKVDSNLAKTTFERKKYSFHPIARRQLEKVCKCPSFSKPILNEMLQDLGIA